MTRPIPISVQPAEGADPAALGGTLVVFAEPSGGLTPMAVEVDRLTGGLLGRVTADPAWKVKSGATQLLAFPPGLAARTLILACLGPDPDRAAARETGAAIAKALPKGPATLAVGGAGVEARVAEMLHTLALRLYEFTDYKSQDQAEENGPREPRSLTALAADAGALEAALAPFQALAEGVVLARDLVNEPANTLTTNEFARRLEELVSLGVAVQVIDEPELAGLGARALLAVGQGSESPSKIVVMTWPGGEPGAAPVALVGKGVVFDTGGISIKPAGGMEEMTMDMGGAAVVAGAMRTLALRKAKANVVGAVGLVENMPDGRAQRPGDIVRSMKGDTIEVINTDAEGRLVLADVLWHVQETVKPKAIVDLATLTGAIIVALGHAMAGYYATDDGLAEDIRKAAEATGDAAWRMPLGKPYAEQIKSRLADLKNTGGRNAGSITAAEFLHRFVKDGTPWAHIDIAGVTLTQTGTTTAPKGATGWGVALLDELIRARFEV